MARSRDQEDQEEQPEDYPDYPDGIVFKKFSHYSLPLMQLVAEVADRTTAAKASRFQNAVSPVLSLYY